ncbi:CDP-glycerol glycerophosphotransferase family protein [Micrococcales bacterium 31B]|nr:CDP-glycerol glycerophosphotransferase family protein [Micrococcales bacterium 31B]
MSVKIPSTDRSKRPLFTVILAVYNVEKYIRATLKSLENQTYPFKLLDVIVVDDGSTDSSYRIVREWAARHPNVRHLTQENAGPGAARAKALPMARGTWITVVDPDDILHPKYFAQVESFLQRDADRHAVMLTTRVVLLQDETGELTETHPLDPKYQHGDRLSRLADEPNNIQLGATAFLLNDVIREHELTYDHRIKPTFEDGHLLGRYLAVFDDPIVGVVATARYLYRKRGDSSSLVQQSWHHRERYVDMLQYGFLDLLLHARRRYGHVPRWVQNMVLYDIMWYFKEDAAQLSRTGWLDDETREVFLELLVKIFTLIDVAAIREFSLHGVRWATREAIIAYFTTERIIPSTFFRWRDKPETGNISLTILQSSLGGEFTFLVDGRAVEPLHQKVISHQYFGQEMLLEAEYQLPPGTSLVVLNRGIPMRQERIVGGKWNAPKPTADAPRLGRNPRQKPKPFAEQIAQKVPSRVAKGLGAPFALAIRQGSAAERTVQRQLIQRARRVRNRLTVRSLTTGAPLHKAFAEDARMLLGRNRESVDTALRKSADSVLMASAKARTAKERYEDAWVIMDRPHAAGDNGEHLYRYVAEHRPDVNAYFLLNQDASDWDRLAADGFRLVAYGSDEAVRLCVNAKYKVSSDATADVMYPIDRGRFGTHGKFIFLQHGVTKDDISKWIGPKAIDLIITVTRAEYDSIAGDRTPYKFSSKEVALTGFPRFDKIWLETHRRDRRPDTILIVPTWRQSLRDDMVKAISPEAKAAVFLESDYGRNWIALATNAELREFASQHGLKITYVLHPSLAFMKEFEAVASVLELTTFGEIDFPELLGRTSVLVTDYSSVAFDAAFGGVPVAYFQFDGGDIFNGAHTTRKGYFDYERDGFGPISTDLVDMVRNVQELAAGSFSDAALYCERVQETFPYRDANNCARVVTAIENL